MSAMAQADFMLLLEKVAYMANVSIINEISHGGEKKQQQQQNITSSTDCLHKVSLWFLTAYSFKLKLKGMFCIQSFRNASTALSTW